MDITRTHSTLASRLWPADGAQLMVRNLVLIAAGTLLLAASAHIQVPFWPVKMSMQSFVVMAIGIAYGSRLAGVTVLAYLAEGALGLPVFQSTVGVVAFAGPTAGYLAGFLVQAVIVGFLMERGLLRNVPMAVAGLLLSEIVLFVLGVAWLSNMIGLEAALQGGLYIFLPAEALKIALATATVFATNGLKR